MVPYCCINMVGFQVTLATFGKNGLQSDVLEVILLMILNRLWISFACNTNQSTLATVDSTYNSTHYWQSVECNIKWLSLCIGLKMSLLDSRLVKSLLHQVETNELHVNAFSLMTCLLYFLKCVNNGTILWASSVFCLILCSFLCSLHSAKLAFDEDVALKNVAKCWCCLMANELWAGITCLT